MIWRHVHVRSKSVAGAGLGTGIGGLSLGVLNSLGGLGALGGLWGNNRTAQNDVLTAAMTAELLRGRSCAPLRQRLECCCQKQEAALECERKERRCNDDILVNYINSTFYAKLAANVTTGTTTTAQPLYNPLPACSCDCGR